ncbi:MAG: TetR/AcrR family transcriptional regulator [Alphaproteobacteria bacterium]
MWPPRPSRGKRSGDAPPPEAAPASGDRATHQEILDGALSCFLRQGYERTTIRDICRESGVSIGSVYHFFPGKEELAGELVSIGVAGWSSALVEALAGDPDPEATVRRLVHASFDWVERNADLYDFIQNQRGVLQVSGLIHRVDRVLEDAQRQVVARLDAMVASGALRKLPVAAYWATIVGGPMWVLMGWVRRERAPFGDLADRIADVVWDGLRSAGS